MSLASTAAKGGGITILGQGAKVVVQLVSLIVLSRLLTPETFGLFAIITIFYSFGEMIRDFGISTAAIQADKISHQQQSNLLWVNTVLGLMLTISIASLSPFISSFFNQPSLLLPLIGVSLGFLVNGFQAQFQVVLVRQHKFGKIAISEILGQIIGLALAITLAFTGAGVWALVAQLLLGTFITTLLRVFWSKWQPALPKKGEPIRSFLTYGWYLGLAQLLGFAANRIDSFLIGASLGTYLLGIYNRGYQLVVVPSGMIVSPLTNLAISILTKVKDSKATFTKYLSTAQKATGYLNGWIMAIILVLAVEIVNIALGSQWREAVPVIQILSVAMAVQILSTNSYWVFLVYAKTKALLNYNIVTKGLVITLILIGSQWGMFGIASGYALGLILSWPINIVWLAKVTDFEYKAIFKGGVSVIFVFVISSALSSGLAHLVAWPNEVAKIVSVIGVITAVFVLYLLLIDRGFLRDSRSVLKSVLKK